MSSNTFWIIFVLSLLTIKVFGKPEPQLPLAGAVFGIGALAGVAIDNSQRCAFEAGCHKGYCWTYCGLSLSSGDWCYTTKTYSQSFDYVRCSRDDECDKCWKCAGSCTL